MATKAKTGVIVANDGLAGATPAFREAVERGRQLMNTMSQTALDGYRELGQMARDMTKRPEAYGGQSAVQRFADCFEWSASQVYKMRAFAEAYTDQQYKRLCSLQMPDGRQLSWSHAIQFISISDTKEREKLQSEAASLGWTASQLEREIAKRLGGNRRPGSGRKFAQPKNPEEAFNAMSVFAAEVTRRTEQIWPVQLAAVSELDPNAYSVGLYKTLDQAVKSTEAVATMMQDQMEQAQRIRRHVKSVLLERGETLE